MSKPKNTREAEKFAASVLKSGDALLGFKNNIYVNVKPGDRDMAAAIENTPRKS